MLKLKNDNLKINTKVFAFSLAEVLVVITIIGVIASMTIPSLIQSVQDAQFKVAWKKTYSVLSQVTESIKEDNGGTMVGFGKDEDYIVFTYAKYLKTIKSCYWDYGQNNCWHDTGEWKDLRGVLQLGYGVSIILADGTLIETIDGTGSDCTDTSLIVESCGTLNIDVNGFKGPNTIGKDIYGVHVTKNGLVPFGAQNDSFSASSHCDVDAPDDIYWPRGWACSAKRLLE